MEPSDPRWDAFAAREPFFAVFTHPKYLRNNLTEEARGEFFDSGCRLVDSLFHTIAQHILPEFAPTSILEFGCGVGRLAIPFATHAASVTAVDASPAMLDVARDEAARSGAQNIAFKLETEWRHAPRRYDLVNCYLVLQRLRPAAGLALFRELLGCIGTGGVGVFQFPYRGGAHGISALTRRIRESSTAVNRIFNIARGKAADLPFMASHVYDLNKVLSIAEAAGFHSSHITFEQHAELGGAILYLTRPLLPGSTPAVNADVSAAEPPPDASRSGNSPRQDLIDPRQMIAETSIEALNETAEKYFRSLTEWEHHLAKPFSKADETPPLLLNLAVLLQGLDLVPGLTILEFGAGTGWLSRYLTQLGCRMILLDVSPTALRIARELYERQPPIGERPAPQFLEFDGRRIELEDGSVDRILCFDSFHHSTDPDATLREFARILRPAGIAAFAEPGPHHSRTPQSQFEMRTYGVIENDVDVHSIWRSAKDCGFAAMKLAAFHVPPFHVTLEEYEDLLAGGETAAAWTASTRAFLRDVRNFFLVKEGVQVADSRRAIGLAAVIEAQIGGQVIAGHPVVIDVRVTNSGSSTWLPSNEELGGVALGAHLYDGSGQLLTFDLHWERLTEPPRKIAPGETVSTIATLPPLDAGQYIIELDCVAARVTWFAQAGSTPSRIVVDVSARG